MTRRLAGGYVWQEELERICLMSDSVRAELLKLVPQSRTVETASKLAHLVSTSAEISSKARQLQEYKPQ